MVFFFITNMVFFSIKHICFLSKNSGINIIILRIKLEKCKNRILLQVLIIDYL